MKASIRQLMIGTLTACGLATPLAAAPFPRAGVFVYSSLCEGPEDAGGAEIVLRRGPTSNMAIFTRTEGPIMAPLLAFGPDVKVDDRTGHITMRFVDPEFGSAGTYLLEGTVTAQQMNLSSSIVGSIKLPRITAFELKLSACRK